MKKLIASEIDANKEQNASVNVDNNMTEANATKDQQWKSF